MENKASQPQRSKKNTYKFSSGQPGKQIIISSQFDSGNIELVKQITQLHYRLAAVPDDGKSNGKKAWFYFKVKVPGPIILRFTITNVSVLYSAYQNGLSPGCVCKQSDQEQWRLIPSMFMTLSQESELIIEYYFKTIGFTYFALTVPLSYYQQIMYLQDLDDTMCKNKDIYYKREVLTKSTLGLELFLMSITSQEEYGDQLQDRIHERLFLNQIQRPVKIRKPVVFIACRVHPGQVTASHTLNGMLQFLASSDIRAYLLRKLFLFIIVPMANPDGVQQGNYRMNSSNINLNRVYNLSTPDEYPQIFAIRSAVQYYNLDGRLQFFFDMHGHSSAKGAFIYGNALDNIVAQVQTQLFCKLLSLNSQYFSFADCSFSEKHMSMRDKNQPLSKEGCSRVVIGRSTGVIHCLTLQTGICKIPPLQQIAPIQFQDFQYKDMGLKKYTKNRFLEMFYEIGRAIAISLLDRVQKNPFSRLPNTIFKNLQGLRKILAFEVLNNQQRFKMLDMKAYQKAKFITKYSNQAFTDKINKKWSYIYSDSKFQSIQWPNDFDGFKIKAPIKKSVSKSLKSKTQTQIPQNQSTSVSRKLLKSLSPTQKLGRQATIIQQQIANNIIEPIQIIFTEQYQAKKKINKDRSLTRKMLRDFSNERQSKFQESGEQKSRTKIISTVNLIAQDEQAIEDFKQKMNAKIQLRKNYNMLKKGITRIRTDLKQQSPDLLVVSQKRLLKYTQTITLPSQQPPLLQQPQDQQQQILQQKIRKIRVMKKQLLNSKIPSQIKKRTSLKFPEIRKSFKKQEPLNLQQLRKDIQAIKLISVTSYNLTKDRLL